eukprot:3503608-Rhodomonas_salina.3
MRAICFSGSGCLATYQFGVAQCLLKHGKPLMSTVSHIVGCSGGSLVAAVLARAPAKLDAAIQLSLQCKNLTAVQEVLDDHTLQQLAAGSPKLVVSTSTAALPAKEIQFSDFPEASILLNCLRASCHFPRDFHPLDMLSPFPSAYKDGLAHEGQMVMDGGFASAIPKIANEENILVSPMSGPGIHICPEEKGSSRWLSKRISGQRFYVNTENVRRFGISMVGGPVAMMQEYLEQGFDDCKKYLKREKLFQA